ncbi:MAG: hypothetical protein P8185_02880 [Deltaproteobacteria bacterium]
MVPGSNSAPMILGDEKFVELVVESELDGILLNQEVGDLTRLVALGSAQIRPDMQTTECLKRTWKILVALDSDEAGAKEAFTWWLKQFPNAERWPVILGKDPSEAKLNGLNLRDWVFATFPFLENLEERAAIIEYEGGKNRKEAEHAAFNFNKPEWQNTEEEKQGVSKYEYQDLFVI